jgi:hypothetical protein
VSRPADYIDIDIVPQGSSDAGGSPLKTPWAKFSLPGEEPGYARGYSPEFRRAIREIFGPLVEWVTAWPEGSLAWLMAEVPSDGSLSSFFRDLEKRLEPAGSLWVVFPKKPFSHELSFPFSWSDVQQAGLDAGLVDNKIAAFSARLTSIRFVVPLARRKGRSPK